MTLREALDIYRQETGSKHARMVERWLSWGGQPDDQLLARYVRHLRDEQLSDATIDLHLRTIRAFYRRFGVRPPSVRGWRFDAKTSNRPALDREFVLKMIDAAKTGHVWSWHVPLLVLATVYGMRASEMANVLPEDLDSPHARIYIRTMKGGIRRWVHFPTHLHKFFAGWSAPSLSEIERSFDEVWSAVSDESKPLGVGWHSCRRALVRDLRLAGVPEDAVIRFLRWKSARDNAAKMLDLYSNPNLLVTEQGARAVTEFDQGSPDYDAEVWQQHPYCTRWRDG
jgi:integrase